MLKISQRGRRIPASPIRKLHPLAVAARERGVSVINLNIGQPDLPTPHEFFDAASKFPTRTVAYSPSQGIQPYIDGLVHYYQQVGLTVQPHEITGTIGGSEAITMALLCCANPGQRVLCFEPYYTNYYSLAMTAGVHMDVLPTTIDDGFRPPKEEEIRAAITPRTRAIIICNPSNPTGTVLTKDELDMIARVALEKKIFIISDEVYREFCYEGAALTYWNYPGMDDQIILADSLSKRYSACGVRLGCVVTKNKGLQQAFLRIGQSRLSAGTFDMHACVPLFYLGKDYYAGVTNEYRKRRDALTDGLQKIPGVKCHKPEGAFYMLTELPVEDADKFCSWLLTDFNHEGATVMLAPANGFYLTPGKGQREVRIAYVVEEPRLRQAVTILEKALQVYPGKL